MSLDDTTSEQLDSLLDAAVRAAGVLARTSPRERAAWLDALADALDARADDLVPLAVAESHLTSQRLTGELARTSFQLRLFGDELRDGAYLRATIDHADPGWGMGPRPDLRRTVRPIGPVAIWAASNFPFAFSVLGGDTASAVAAGSPVLLKSHPGHPGLSAATGALAVEALRTAGAPDGVFALVSGVDIGRELIRDPRIQAGAFTGSLAGGRALYDLASSRPSPIPFFGELGSVNPSVVTRGGARDRSSEIASGFASSVALGVGQFCTNPGVLLVPAESGLVDDIARHLGEVPGAPMLTPGLAAAYAGAVGELAGRPGVTVVSGSAEPDQDPAPTVLSTTVPALLAAPDELTRECFGPAALVIRYESDDELLAAVAAFDGQLTTSVHGDADEAIVPRLLELLAERSGRVLWNQWPTGVSVTHAMQHGGPYPATTSVQTTSVGTAAIDRFVRPVSYQNLPQGLLPEAVRDANPWGVPQRVDGVPAL
jgi:NADP-dependent aldehyde dehydrogenase